MNNRALEFLNEASRLLVWWGNSEQGRMLVNLAIGEVRELLDRVAELEAQHATPTALPKPNGDGRGVLVVEAQPMTPARLAARPRAALPGKN